MVSKNFAIFGRKHLCSSLFFNKIADLSPATLLKKRLQHTCFPVNIEKLLRTPIFQNICERLFLYFRILKIIFFEKWKNGKLKTRKRSQNSEISEKFFGVFWFLGFQFCPKAKIENSDLKILISEISEISEVSDFLTWPSSTKLAIRSAPNLNLIEKFEKVVKL